MVLIWMVKGLSEFESNLTSIERIKEYCDLDHEADWVVDRNRPAKEWPTSGNVTFQDVSVKYREDLDFVLNQLSFEIKPKEKASDEMI
jgi:ATP-binding cassette subfamily C (CFTR/MRP) protein 1